MNVPFLRLLATFAIFGLCHGAVPMARQRDPEVCLTPECAVAAASIIQSMDIEADPCEDFYRFACGGWMDSNVIPDGMSKWGAFYELRDQVNNALKTIVTDPSNSASTTVASLKAMYNGCMDTETIEAAGVPTLLLSALGQDAAEGGWPMLLEAGSWDSTKFDASEVMGQIRNSQGLNVLLSIFVYLDDFNTEHNIIYVDQPDLGLPMSMYLDLDSYADYIAAYKTYMVDTARVMVRELGTGVSDEQLAMAADKMFDFEREVAMRMTPSSDRRNSTAMYNPMTIAELKALMPNMDWDKYLAAVFVDTDVTVGDDETVIVVEPGYLQTAQEIEADFETIVNYMYWRSIMPLNGEMTEELRDIAFKFSSAMTGVTEKAARWMTCTAKAVNAFGFAAAHEYVKANFAEESKAQADAMVEDLRAAFKELVSESEWMDAATQERAAKKADQMLQLIGYPDWLTDPSKVDEYYLTAPETSEQDHFLNMVSTGHWAAIQDLKTLREIPNRDIWLMHPAIVNAWYSPNHNTITFPAGILQAPFFKGGWPRYLNYGAMGMVIGHEITHGFDDQGRQYDGTGSLSPWWSDETIAAFAGKAQCFIDQYGNYTVPELIPILGEEDAHLNGELTQGENIADNGGIHESFRAYQRSIESLGAEPALPGLTQFTPEQMFFISNAQVWCEIKTPEALLGQVLGDPHSPGRFRVIGPLGNSEDFQAAYGCPVDSAMNRGDEKCLLW